MTPALALVELRRGGVWVRLDAAGVVMLDSVQCPPAGLLALARAHRDGIRALPEGGSGTAFVARLAARLISGHLATSARQRTN